MFSTGFLIGQIEAAFVPIFHPYRPLGKRCLQDYHQCVSICYGSARLTSYLELVLVTYFLKQCGPTGQRVHPQIYLHLSPQHQQLDQAFKQFCRQQPSNVLLMELVTLVMKEMPVIACLIISLLKWSRYLSISHQIGSIVPYCSLQESIWPQQ